MRTNKSTKKGKSSMTKRGKNNPYSKAEAISGGRDDRKFISDKATTDKFNDVSWYSKNEQMLKDAASFSYNRPLGAKIDMSKYIQSTSDEIVTYPASTTSIPGVMNLAVAMGPGLSQSYNSPINLAAQNIFSYVRFNNSGAKNYEPADLMFYMFSMDSGYALYNHLKRAYGILRSYSQENWYYPRLFIEAMGLDFDDLMNNISDFRLFINTLGTRLSSFCVPAVMPIFIRHSWLFSNIWKDSNDPKAQCYMFNPLYFFRYEEKTEGGGSLIPEQWLSWTSNSTIYNNQFNPQLMTFEGVQIYANQLINALSRSEDIGIMSGDILKAYGQDKLFKLSPVPEDYVVEPVYNEEVLNQIHNATVVYQSYADGDVQDPSWVISQNVNSQTIVYNPHLRHEPTNIDGLMVNMPWSDVTPANTMVGTRLTSAYTSDSQDYSYFNALGTEFIAYAMIGFYNYKPNSGMQYEPEWYSFKTILTLHCSHQGATDETATYSAAEVNDFINKATHDEFNRMIQHMTILALCEQFDWHPIIYNYVTELQLTPQGTADVVQRICAAISADVSNYTFIKSVDLMQMHLTAIMSEFNIPQIGSF